MQSHGVRAASGDAAAALALGTGLSLVAFVCLTYLFSALTLIVGLTLESLIAVAIMFLSFAVAGLIGTASRPDLRPAVFVLLAAVLAVSAGFSLLLSDTTIDGQWYHFQAVAALAEGWNPYYESFTGVPSLGEPGYSIWPEHYPLAHWIVMGVSFSAGLPLEAVKFIQPALIMAAGLLTFAALRQLGLSLAVSLFVALAASANPVAVSQIFSKMNDGLIASSLLIFAALAMLWMRSGQRVFLGMLAGFIVFAVNIKFTAIPIFVVACAIFTAILVWTRSLRASIQPAATLAGAGLFGIIVVGFSPYVQNFAGFGHPFYPLMAGKGVQATDIMTLVTPEAIKVRSDFEAFWFSLFATSHSGFPPGEPVLKLPFTLADGELYAAGAVDTQIAGFGPLFSGAFFVSAGLVVFLLVTQWRKPVPMLVLSLTIAVLAFTVVFPESWWARYVPQLWLVPVGFALAALLTDTRPAQLAAFGVLAILLTNSTIVFISNAKRCYDRQIAIEAQIDRFTAIGGQIVIDPDLSVTRLRVLQRRGIDFRVEAPIDPTTCIIGEQMASYGGDLPGGYVCIKR
ncbi:MAG: hypothetical protein ACK46Q_06715 [Hyphomonas sp.]